MRLIDADALKEGLKEKMFGHSFERIFVSSVVDSEPTIDAVPAVRCRECKHRKDDDMFGMIWCNLDSCTKRVKQDDFCSYGNRKEDS